MLHIKSNMIQVAAVHSCALLSCFCPEMLAVLGRGHFGSCEVLQPLYADIRPLILCLCSAVAFVCCVCLMLLSQKETDTIEQWQCCSAACHSRLL